MINFIKKSSKSFSQRSLLSGCKILTFFSQQTSKPLSYYYKVLGVNQGCTNQQLKSAYLQMIKKHHPDLSKDPNSAQKFREVQKAYDYILQAANKKKQQPTKQWQQSQSKSKAKEQDGFDGEKAEQFQQLFKERYSKKSRADQSMQFSYNLYKKHHEQMEKKKNQYIKVTGREKQEWIHKNQPQGGSFWYTAGVGGVMIGLIGGAILFVNAK